MNNINILEFIKKSPKAELHLHIEGTLEPEQMISFAKRNNVQTPFKNIIFFTFQCISPRKFEEISFF